MQAVEAIKHRQSVRAYLDKPVSKETIEALIDAARFAPSGTNTQPWKVIAITGETKQALTEAYLAKFNAGVKQNPDYNYYPIEWSEPYISRRRTCGLALYSALDIKHEDKERRREVWALNYQFFHAPVGLMFTIDKRLSRGSWLDMGMFIQNVMVAAEDFDLGSCPQASMAEYPDEARRILGLSEDQLIVCGMSIGYPNWQDPINQYRTERENVSDILDWKF